MSFPSWFPLVGVIVLGTALPGCAVPADLTMSEVAGASAEAALVAGIYWIELEDGTATAHPLENVRVTETFQTLGNAWYAGAGWYELTADGIWLARDDLSEFTLDDLLQVQNPVR